MINVVTTPELGELLQQHNSIENIPNAAKYRSLQKWLEKKKARLVPNFPDNNVPPLQTYFQLETSATLTKDDLDALLQLPGIDGAYNKPADDLPV